MQLETGIKFLFISCIYMGLLFSSYAMAGAVDTGENSMHSLCDANDSVFFSCTTKNNKLISLCGKGERSNPSGIYYRFGKAAKIEMDFPSNKDETSISKFSYSNYYKGTNIHFNNNGYSYVLFEPYSNSSDEDRSGIAVSEINTNKQIAVINCKMQWCGLSKPVEVR